MLKIITAIVNIVLAFTLGYNAIQLLLRINSISLAYNYIGHYNRANELHSPISKLDITTLSNAYLFGKVSTPHIATQNKNIPPDTKMNLKLQGIYHGSASYASINSNNNKAFYQVGDSLPNGVVLHAIFPKKV
ncbi:type II secretion system protein N, partial [Thiotrichales bacterium HSG1]|nr:type II secretion system protein N [Thiotrichales bacterium HSG1]